MSVDLKASMILAGQSLLNCLNPDMEFLPTGGYEIAHDTGRWWDAMLRLEHVVDFEIPADIEGAMLRNLQRLTDFGHAMLMVPPEMAEFNRCNVFNLHNLRETLLAYHSLVRYRGSRWSLQRGRKLIEMIDGCLDDRGRLDCKEVVGHGGHEKSSEAFQVFIEYDGWFDVTTTTGRCLEALVLFYQATGEVSALHDSFATERLRNG